MTTPARTPTSPVAEGTTPRGTRIDLDGVGKRYRIGDVDVDPLVGFDLHVDKTSFVVILGPTGSGTTRGPTRARP